MGELLQHQAGRLHIVQYKKKFYAYQLKRDNWIKSTKYNKRIFLSTIPFSLWFVFAFLEININTPSSWFALYQHLEIYFFLVFPLNFNYLIEAYFEGKCDVFLGIIMNEKNIFNWLQLNMMHNFQNKLLKTDLIVIIDWLET